MCQGDQLWRAGGGVPGGRKVRGGSQSDAIGRVAGGGGVSAPRSAGAVEVAPVALGGGGISAPLSARAVKVAPVELGCEGISVPRSARAVKVAPDILGDGVTVSSTGPARAGPESSGGFARRQRDVMPAAELGRPPPPRPVAAGVGVRSGPGPSPHHLWNPEPWTRALREVSEASLPWN